MRTPSTGRLPDRIDQGDVSLQSAVSAVRQHSARSPTVAIVLGSGLGGLADEVVDASSVPVDQIPGYPRSSVAGHAGELVLGSLEGQDVVMVRGRVHCYEGYDARTVAFPVRLVHALGARRLIVTNAAGGIHPDLYPGALMLISDHLNMALRHPIPGRPADPGGHFPHPARRHREHYYDPDWLNAVEEQAMALGVRTHRGVYVWTLGPTYETKAEIRFFQRAGADAVGMSTVPEVIQAHDLGMRVLGISTITNRAAGLGSDSLSHDDVLEVGAGMQGTVRRLIRSILRNLDAP